MTIDIDTIERRAEQASPGPWEVTKIDAAGCEISSVGGQQIVGQGYNGGGCWEEDDATFLASARTDVPTLLAEVRRLREENQHLRARLATGGKSPADAYGKHAPRA